MFLPVSRCVWTGGGGAPLEAPLDSRSVRGFQGPALKGARAAAGSRQVAGCGRGAGAGRGFGMEALSSARPLCDVMRALCPCEHVHRNTARPSGLQHASTRVLSKPTGFTLAIQRYLPPAPAAAAAATFACSPNACIPLIAIALAKSERAARHTAIRTLRGGDRPKSGAGEGMKTSAGREKRAKGAGELTLKLTSVSIQMLILG